MIVNWGSLLKVEIICHSIIIGKNLISNTFNVNKCVRVLNFLCYNYPRMETTLSFTHGIAVIGFRLKDSSLLYLCFLHTTLHPIQSVVLLIMHLLSYFVPLYAPSTICCPFDDATSIIFSSAIHMDEIGLNIPVISLIWTSRFFMWTLKSWNVPFKPAPKLSLHHFRRNLDASLCIVRASSRTCLHFNWMILGQKYNTSSMTTVITYIVAGLPYSIFQIQCIFSARSLTYEMLRWTVLTDHYFVSGLLYSLMSGMSLRTLRSRTDVAI